ncbi:Lrp/AsnC family transcriptional regulator [Streptomyces longispororuber]|uniref:Lrp/AsnC family transcriptional regulator n=1 Tax=Streptomyces longispororuber TaxID=68230 RepID=UPI00210D352B|nr:Lrp/AsnC family transcriptional regulator [Streptomyces longispororuber]MCQ4206414.1 Lrp/AsnC family transcriptional regulator [Streptomyces longispororuber]
MPPVAAPMPESIAVGVQDSVSTTADLRELDEMDMALVDALQTSPRAPWSRIGAVLGIDATTAARRWDRLRAAGLAWSTAYETWERHEPRDGLCIAFAEVAVAPGSLTAATAAACADPRVASVERTTGGTSGRDAALFLTLFCSSTAALTRLADGPLAELPGVRDIQLAVMLHSYREGADWKVHALDRGQRSRLASARVGGASGLHRGGADRALLRALAFDARRPYSELARDTGTSEATVRRRVARMLASGQVRLRCDVSHLAAGRPVISTYRIAVPSAELDAAGHLVAGLSGVRLCMAVTGETNLLVSTWTSSLSESAAFEVRLGTRLPAARILRRDVTLLTTKRMGRLLDDAGRARGHVPLVPHQTS